MGGGGKGMDNNKTPRSSATPRGNKGGAAADVEQDAEEAVEMVGAVQELFTKKHRMAMAKASIMSEEVEVLKTGRGNVDDGFQEELDRCFSYSCLALKLCLNDIGVDCNVLVQDLLNDAARMLPSEQWSVIFKMLSEAQSK